MYAHRFFGRIALALVWTVGIGYAGELFGAEGGAREKGGKAAADVSRELAMRPLPAYRIGPPDILQIEVTTSGGAAVGGVGTSDGVGTGFLKGEGFVGHATVADSDEPGKIRPNTYTGVTRIGEGSLTLSDAKTPEKSTPETGKLGDFNVEVQFDAVPGEKAADQMPKVIEPPPIQKSDSEVARPPVKGQYLVAPDGTVNLRQYGMVQVMGKTVEEAKEAVKKQVAKFIPSPVVTVEVLAYNSKVFYIVTQGAGLGDNIRRLPITGSDTVLDALSAVNGLSQVSSKKMWIARPSPKNSSKGKILPVDYVGITQRGATATNYQLMPGDRLFIAEDKTIAANNWLSKKTAPVERVMGLISLGASTIRSIENVWPESSDDPPKSEESDE